MCGCEQTDQRKIWTSRVVSGHFWSVVVDMVDMMTMVDTVDTVDLVIVRRLGRQDQQVPNYSIDEKGTVPVEHCKG